MRRALTSLRASGIGTRVWSLVAGNDLELPCSDLSRLEIEVLVVRSGSRGAQDERLH